jgi:hypothetical protein
MNTRKNTKAPAYYMQMSKGSSHPNQPAESDLPLKTASLTHFSRNDAIKDANESSSQGAVFPADSKKPAKITGQSGPSPSSDNGNPKTSE